MKIVLAGLLENISSRADGSIKLTFGTQEIEPQQAGELFQLRGQYSKLLLSNTNIEPDEEAAMDEAYIKDGRKRTKAGRLRSTFFVIWNKSKEIKNTVSFETFYNDEMEKLIEAAKERIEPDPQPE